MDSEGYENCPVFDIYTCTNILKTIAATVCRLGMFNGKIPYIVPMNFCYRNNTLYFHSARVGRKIDILKKNANICFEIDIPGEVISSEDACSWSMNYRSIMGTGKAVFISNDDEKAEAFNIIMGHYSGKTDWDIDMNMLRATSVFKVRIDNISAKKSGS